MRAQAHAEAHLQAAGYKIIARNFRVRGGEVDLIAQNGSVFAFVEVKFRTGTAYGMPLEAVDYRKRKKIIRTALHYIAKNKLDNHDFRFDIIEILRLGSQLYIRHTENAFIVE
jgi:putative endonuclease